MVDRGEILARQLAHIDSDYGSMCENKAQWTLRVDFRRLGGPFFEGDEREAIMSQKGEDKGEH